MTNDDLLNQDYGVAAPATTATATAAEPAKANSDAWKTGYDTLAKQLQAIQSKADVYKRGSPLDANTHINNIATSLARDYGITNLSDIGVREIIRPGYQSGSDESATWIPDEKVPEYYNKKDPTKVIPGYKFASEGAGKGFSDYNLQSVSDGKGGTIVVPVQQYSKSGLGAFVQDLGPILPVINLTMMAAGVPPLLAGAGNLALQGAAGNINDFNDALRIAAPFALAGGLQALDVVGPSLAATTAGRIAENYGGAAGLTGFGADIAGGALSNAVKAGLTGDDILASALSGAVAPGLSAAGRAVTSGLKDAYGSLTGFAPDVNPDDFSADELAALGGGSSSNNIFGNLTDDELNDLYGSTALTSTNRVTNPGSGVISGVANSITGNLTDDELNDLYASTASTGVTGNLTNEELNDLYGSTAATGMPTVDDLELMDARNINGIQYSIDKNGNVFYIDDNGDVGSLTKTQFNNILSTDLTNTESNLLDRVIVRASGNTDLTSNNTNLTDLATLTNLTQINPLGSSQVAAITSNQVAAITSNQATALTTDNTNTLTTSNANTISTSQFNALSSTQIAALAGTIGTGILLSDVTGGGTTKTTGPATALTTGTTALSTSVVPALTSGTTTLDTSQITALTTMDPLGLRGIADPNKLYWQQTGVAGTGGQGGVRYFDWTTNPIPSMGGSNIEAAKALSSVPAFTSAQAAAMTAPVGKQYYNASTNRYYTDPTGNWQAPAGWVQKPFKDGGEVETQHFDGGGSIFDFDTGIDLAANTDYLNLMNNPGFDINDVLGSANSALDQYTLDYLQGLPSDNASYGGGPDLTSSYQQDIKDAAGPASSFANDAAKKVTDALSKAGAKLSQSALDSITNNPGAWLAALAGAGLGYAAKPQPIAPMGLRGLGMTQQQVYGALKGVPISRAEGGEIDGYAGGGGLHYLKSAEDGMADKIPATIDNKQPARLSGGEFVIPADVVSHLGNGNSEAGAKQLYEMMDRIRHARTGNKEQGKQINPAKFTPK
jgi:hypothetical protein